MVESMELLSSRISVLRSPYYVSHYGNSDVLVGCNPDIEDRATRAVADGHIKNIMRVRNGWQRLRMGRTCGAHLPVSMPNEYLL